MREWESKLCYSFLHRIAKSIAMLLCTAEFGSRPWIPRDGLGRIGYACLAAKIEGKLDEMVRKSLERYPPKPK